MFRSRFILYLSVQITIYTNFFWTLWLWLVMRCVIHMRCARGQHRPLAVTSVTRFEQLTGPLTLQHPPPHAREFSASPRDNFSSECWNSKFSGFNRVSMNLNFHLWGKLYFINWFLILREISVNTNLIPGKTSATALKIMKTLVYDVVSVACTILI